MAAVLAVAPAVSASETIVRVAKRATTAARVTGSFTPAAADPKMAALFARSGLDSGGFRFTPSETRNAGRSVTVAVRARSNAATRDNGRLAFNSATVGIAPIAYNLGMAVGWKRFAVSGDLSKVDLATIPGGRESADVALSYSGHRFSGQVRASSDRAVGTAPKLVEDSPSYALDVGGSYSLTRNIDLTAGMRYKSERDRLVSIEDDRRDSQAVYVGTAFRF